MRSFARLPRAEKINLVLVIGGAAIVLVKVSTAGSPVGDPVPFGFWIALTLVASFVQVRLPSDVRVSVNTAPLIAAVFDPSLNNPFAICWIALLGTFELRDFKRQIPWFGTLYNRADFVLAAFAARVALTVTEP